MTPNLENISYGEKTFKIYRSLTVYIRNCSMGKNYLYLDSRSPCPVKLAVHQKLRKQSERCFSKSSSAYFRKHCGFPVCIELGFAG